MTVITEDNPLPVQLYDAGAPTRELVMLPFRQPSAGNVVPNGAGTGSGDGTRTNYFGATLASSTWANTTSITVAFMGSTFGLRFSRQYYSPFGVRIDGVAYEVPYSQRLKVDTQLAAPTQALGEGFIIADDLGDGPHEAEIILPCSVSQTRNWQFYGYLVEARGNPPAPVPGMSLLSAGVDLTTSFAGLNYNGISVTGICGLIFRNTSGADRVVSLRYSSGNGVFADVDVPNGKSVSWAPPGGRPLYHTVEIAADATGVKCFMGTVN